MREYKFRAKKNTYVDKWVYGYLVSECYISEKDELGYTPVRKETVGQYTGLHDKNGKEIYEGDIVKSFFVDTDEAGNEIYKYYIIEVKYDEVLCSYKIDKFMNLEVIGNIYENKELINETNR